MPGDFQGNLTVSEKRRFYKEVAISPGLGILLDGKPVKTPLKAPLELPSPALASAVAAEWQAQGSTINPHSMPLTKLANTAIDRASGELKAIRRDILAYAGNDLVCYRAEAPAGLVVRQAHAWDPVLAWARQKTGVEWRTTTGLRHIEQQPEALKALADLLPERPFELVGCHALTTLSGSALLALMLLEEAISVENAWQSACAEEFWQRDQWGEDGEATARIEAQFREFGAAYQFVNLARM
jgi:chaperone required for assembly of F1-ATPase